MDEKPKQPLGWSLNPDGNVVITMTQNDWNELLLTLGYAAGHRNRELLLKDLALLNRLNAGNPHYTPYQVEE